MRYRLTAPTGQVLDEGEGRAELAGGALVVSPALGQPLRIRPADITEVSEPEPFVVRLRLAEGATLDLLQLGALRTQLLAQVGDVRADDLTSALLLAGLGTPERFHGALGGVDAELRLYDDALVALPMSGTPEQVPYSFVEGVDTDASGYRILISTGEGDPLEVQRLARRTTEFVDLLRTRVTDARGRTSAFLGALLPGLGSVGLRSTASLLRDGLAARKSDVDAIDPTIWQALVGSSTLPDRRAGLETLAAMGEAWLGFKQKTSVQVEAESVQAWHDPASAPNAQHDLSTGGMGSGMGAMMTAGVLSGGPPTGLGFGGAFGDHGDHGGGLGGLLALNMLGMTTRGGGGFGGLFGGMGMGGSGAGGHQMTARPDMTRGRLIPAHADLEALTASGQDPTILAFVFVSAKDHVVYEVLNQQDHATYVYRGGPDHVRQLNRALALLGFRVEGVYQDAAGAGSKYRTAVERLPYLRMIRDAFVGRAIHTDEGWQSQLQGLLRR